MLLAVDPLHPEPHVVARAAQLLRDGGLVAFPTETVYGLGANALDADAVARIYAAKGRPAWNPVIAHVATVNAAKALTATWPIRAQQLADAFWPGPLTLVLPRSSIVPDIATAGRDAVAVRIPSHPVALALLHACGFPVAAPSANRFTQISPTTAQHVVASLGDRVDLILDGGACDVGIESTVCDLTGEVPILLRPGMIDRTALARVLGCDVQVADPQVSSGSSGPISTMAGERSTESGRIVTAEHERPHSPGMVDRHYAPDADVWLFNRLQRNEIVSALIARRAAAIGQTGELGAGRVTALLLRERSLPLAPSDDVVIMPDAPAAYAQRLYAALHDADAGASALIVIERPPDTDAWLAVLDRLTRASR